MLITIGKILYLADHYDMECIKRRKLRNKNAMYSKVRQMDYLMKSFGMDLLRIWMLFMTLLERIQTKMSVREI